MRFALVFAVVLAFGFVSVTRAQGPDIQIVQLECVDAPNVSGIEELVVIENRGDATQPLTGWQLQSDPTGSEVFDLTVLGGLQPGASVFIQSGPEASGVFNWGPEFIFRDDDPTDYVRLVDDTGAVVHQVHCAGEVVAQPTPTPSPEPSPQPKPSPSVEPSPAADVPNGGGPPPPSGGTLLAAMMVLVGGAVAAAGVATGALSSLRLRCSPVAGTTASPTPRRATTLRVALVGLLAAALAVGLLRRRPQ